MPKKRMKKKRDVNVNIKVNNLEKKCRRRNANGAGHFWIFGSILAMILSYDRSASILWAILHGVFSWFYVLYRAMQIWGWL